MKYKQIACPFCDKPVAIVTYEERRMYKCRCPICENTILHKDTNWDSAVRFFENLLVAEECRDND